MDGEDARREAERVADEFSTPASEAPTVEGYETAQEAATRLGYAYTYFTTMLNEEGRVPGALRWHDRWMVPTGVTREQIERRAGRPRKGD